MWLEGGTHTETHRKLNMYEWIGIFKTKLYLKKKWNY